MGIYQRENGIWYAKITRKGKTVRRSLDTTNQTEALGRFTIIKEQMLKQLFTLDPVISLPKNSELIDTRIEFSRPSFNQAFTEYLNKSYLDHLAEITIKEKESLLNKLKEQKISWESINATDIMKFQVQLRKLYSASYVAKFVVHLKSFLNYCVKKEYLSLQDYHRLDFMKAPKQKRKKSKISDVHLQEIFDYCEKKGDFDFYYYLLTLYITGSRPNEIINLTYKDLNFTDNTIIISMNKVKDDKIISVNRELLDNLMKFYAINNLNNGCIFTGSLRNKDFYGKKFKRIRESLNLPDHYSLYLFRHTAATNTIDSSNNIYLAQKLLGHTNIKTTTRYILDDTKITKQATDSLYNNLKNTFLLEE